MYSSFNCLLSCVILLLYSSKTCSVDLPTPPSLMVYVPGDPEYTDVLVRRVGDNLTLVCELRGDATPKHYVWNYIPVNGTQPDRSYTETPAGATSRSTLTRQELQVYHSGHYMCSAPPFSTTKYILVQGPGPKYCGRGTFWCGQRCMAPQYVCDGRSDCARAEDEAPHMCSANVCARSDKLNCSTGRCISESACCRASSRPCQQPSCCDEHPRYSRLEGYVDVEYPPLFEDRHAPDDYGFIQSTIYTVTACALIFMIAVVLLVSAICKMHMKRAALRSYAHAERATRHHYSMQYAQTHRFPPCYEASRLLEQEARNPPSPPHSPMRATEITPLQCGTECPPVAPPAETSAERPGGFGLARLSAIFSSRYRQVPTQSDVELTNVRSTSLNNSPTRNRTLDNYRSPTYCDLNTPEFYFTNPETGDYGRDLNCMDSGYRNRNSNGTLERVIEQLDRQRLTLQLGRFQLTIPRFGRRTDTPRPDTPNVAEINIDDLDFMHMTSPDTYTLNGRTIRLLGANFENYPVLPDGTRPPPYNEAMRCKFFGPPPEYLSREGLNSRADEEARNNVEMPPCYDELGGENGSNVASGNNDNNTGINTASGNSNGNSASNIVSSNISNGNTTSNNEIRDLNNTNPSTSNDMTTNIIEGTNNVNSSVRDISLSEPNNNVINNSASTAAPVITVTNAEDNGNVPNNESISAVINNLPAIDSDVNANDTVINC